MTETLQVCTLIGGIFTVGLLLYALSCIAEARRTARGVRLCPYCDGAGIGIAPVCEPCGCENGEVPL